MKRFAKVIDETKKCIVGLGTNIDFYRSEGMTEMEVEQGYDGNWYVAGFAPEKPGDVKKKERIDELQKYLDETDWYAVRFAETGVEIPDEIKAERQAAREEISRLRSGVDNG